MKKIFSIAVIGTFFLLPNSSIMADEPQYEYTVCEGRGEKCRVYYNGVPIGFTKDKDGSAIVIKF